MWRVGVNSGEHVDLLILLIQKLFKVFHLGLQQSYSLFQGLGVASREGSPTELVACFALEANVDTLCTASTIRQPLVVQHYKRSWPFLRSNTVTSDFLGSTAIAMVMLVVGRTAGIRRQDVVPGLRDTGLRARAYLDHLHGKNSWHFGDLFSADVSSSPAGQQQD